MNSKYLKEEQELKIPWENSYNLRGGNGALLLELSGIYSDTYDCKWGVVGDTRETNMRIFLKCKSAVSLETHIYVHLLFIL